MPRLVVSHRIEFILEILERPPTVKPSAWASQASAVVLALYSVVQSVSRASESTQQVVDYWNYDFIPACLLNIKRYSLISRVRLPSVWKHNTHFTASGLYSVCDLHQFYCRNP